jgi:hypothetical protein
VIVDIAASQDRQTAASLRRQTHRQTLHRCIVSQIRSAIKASPHHRRCILHRASLHHKSLGDQGESQTRIRRCDRIASPGRDQGIKVTL